MRKVLIAGAMVAMIGVASAPRAEAALILAARVQDGVTTDVCAVDNNAFVCTWGTQILDENPAPNVLGFGGVVPINVGGLLITSSIQAAVDLPGLALISSSSTTVTNATAGTLTANVAIGQTNFDGPVSRGDTTGSGTWLLADGSLINLEWFNDDANAQGAETPFDRPGVMVNNRGDLAVGALDSFSFNDPFDIVGNETDFSMTLAFDLTLTPGAQLISRGMAEIKQAPEPASLALLGLAFGGLGIAARRRQQRS